MEGSIIKFLIFNGSKLPIPFSEKSFSAYNEKDSGIVIHVSDKQIVNDGKVHVYFQDLNNPNYDFEKYTLNDNDLNYPKIIYVTLTENYDDHELLHDFLVENNYSYEDYVEKNSQENTSFEEFKLLTKNLSLGTFENYIKVMFQKIGFEDQAYEDAKRYMNYFYVAVTASDVEPKDFYNYELLEAIGDHSAWKIMTEIFIEYMVKNNLPLKESVITSMHRSYSSKVIQSKICKDLKLYAFLKTSQEVTVSIREDIFESFTGALFMINELIKMYIGKDYNLDGKFLRWCYKSIDFSDFEEKPEITKFYEYMKILIGPSLFRERKTRKFYYMRFDEEKISNMLYDSLKNHLPNENLKEKIKEVLSLVKVPYCYDLDNFVEERKIKFQEVNSLIEKNFTEEVFIRIRNEKFLSEWEKSEREEFESLTSKDIIIDRRYFDNSRNNFYWVILNRNRDDIHNTSFYPDPEKPSTLISLLRNDNIEKISSNQVQRIPYKGGDYLLDMNNNEKYSLTGNHQEIEEYLKDIMEKREENNFRSPFKYFIEIKKFPYTSKSYTGNSFVEYSPYHEISFGKKFNLHLIRKKLTKISETKYPRMIYRFIGDRMAYGQIALIAMMKHKILDENNLNIIKNFFRSKNLKDEITRLIDIHEDNDPKKPLIHCDELFGMNYETSPIAINNIYSEMIFSNNIIEKPEKKLQKLHKNLTYEKAFTEESRRLQKSKGEIRLQGNQYIYIDTQGVPISIEINYHNYNQVKYYFAKFLINHEKIINPKWNITQNARFLSLPKYEEMSQALEFIGVLSWEMKFEEGKKLISLSYEHEEKLFCIKGKDIDSIVKQFPFIN